MVKLPEYIETRLFINNEWVTSTDTFDLYRPFDGAPLARVHAATHAHVSSAVAAAKAAQPAWERLGVYGRKGAILRFAALIREHTDELALLEGLNTGRSHREATDKAMDYTVSGMLEYFAEAALDIRGETRMCEEGKLLMEIKQPFGVVGAICPWNAAIPMFAWKVGAAVAAGNTIVIKSSEKTPLTSLLLADLIAKAGFPPGVINVLSGPGPTTGAALAAHPDVRKLSFTGSTATGRHLQKVAADTNMKKVQLELGGKSACIIFNDANLPMAAARTAFSMNFLVGQSCFANTRIFVEKGAVDEFMRHFKAAFSKVGPNGEIQLLTDPTDKELMGLSPLIDEIQFKKVMGYIEEGKKYGTPLIGGHKLGDKGFFVAPTIFLDLPPDCALMKEEIFGPVVCVTTFETEEEALALANDTEYGLYASVFTQDASRSIRVARALEAGMVGVNTTSPDIATGLTFGGWKSSGNGREGWSHGLASMVESKSINMVYGPP
ncbi:aldehyde dehydrogenase domain-containing protein [Tricharina praecox]|uniref:aldehyde dehydrogenase domain-containing protein n=1 Tax=Tricharina praecox TaxID=43433 RepID=UPI0022209C1A|nr:aldehyde dehydrogenase domain-containing protein [Tricharina praecox]KAI5858601.1 aldehyde dehydrogenase domain-containing protein [Tricharina praecox]